MGWSEEFGPEHRPPAGIGALVWAGVLKDLSWGNDACPKFGTHLELEDGDVSVVIWCQPELMEEREFEEPRFAVTAEFDVGARLSCDEATITELEKAVETDSLDEAVAVWRKKRALVDGLLS